MQNAAGDGITTQLDDRNHAYGLSEPDRAALKPCDADLGSLPHFLLDSMASQHGMKAFTGSRPAPSIIPA